MCDLPLVIHSVSSQWVRAEAEEGANRNMLVSVLVEDVRIPISSGSNQ
jgi:hypothetical protein